MFQYDLSVYDVDETTKRHFASNGNIVFSLDRQGARISFSALPVCLELS